MAEEQNFPFEQPYMDIAVGIICVMNHTKQNLIETSNSYLSTEGEFSNSYFPSTDNVSPNSVFPSTDQSLGGFEFPQYLPFMSSYPTSNVNGYGKFPTWIPI